MHTRNNYKCYERSLRTKDAFLPGYYISSRRRQKKKQLCQYSSLHCVLRLRECPGANECDHRNDRDVAGLCSGDVRWHVLRFLGSRWLCSRFISGHSGWFLGTKDERRLRDVVSGANLNIDLLPMWLWQESLLAGYRWNRDNTLDSWVWTHVSKLASQTRNVDVRQTLKRL